MGPLFWSCLPLQALDAEGVYEMLALRNEVFVVEQRCLYQDTDGRDRDCLHVMGRDAAGRLLAYARLLPPGLKGPQQLRAAIGRVLTAPSLRGQGQGRPLVRQALRECEQRWPGVGQELSAQAHLQAFYESVGFHAVSPVYDEDGIPHIDMCRDAAPVE